MEAEQTYTNWDLADRKTEDTSDTQSSDFFFDLLSEQRY